MQSTLHYNFPLYEGEDTPNLLVEWNATMQALDTKLYALSIGNAGPEIIREIEQLITAVNGLIDEVTQAISDINELQQTVNGVQSTVTSLFNNIDEIQDSVVALQGVITTVQQLVASLQEDVTGNTDDISALQSSVNTLTSSVSTLNGALENMQTSISGIDNRVTALEQAPAYELPKASANTLGGVKVGNNLSIDDNGVLSATGSGGGGGDYLPYITEQSFTGLENYSVRIVTGSSSDPIPQAVQDILFGGAFYTKFTSNQPIRIIFVNSMDVPVYDVRLDNNMVYKATTNTHIQDPNNPQQTLWSVDYTRLDSEAYRQASKAVKGSISINLPQNVQTTIPVVYNNGESDLVFSTIFPYTNAVTKETHIIDRNTVSNISIALSSIVSFSSGMGNKVIPYITNISIKGVSESANNKIILTDCDSSKVDYYINIQSTNPSVTIINIVMSLSDLLGYADYASYNRFIIDVEYATLSGIGSIQ